MHYTRTLLVHYARLLTMLAMAGAVVAIGGCWTITGVEELGNVRIVHTTSPMEICGTSDSYIESRSGRTLVDHVSARSSGYKVSRDGKWMLAVAWTRENSFRLHGLDLEVPEVVLSVDLPEEDLFHGIGSPPGVLVARRPPDFASYAVCDDIVRVILGRCG